MAEKKELKVKEIIQRAYNVKSVRLEVGCDTNYLAGQFLSVTLTGNPALKRWLSISSSPTEKGYIEFTKKLTASDFSKTLDNLRAGDVVSVEYPFGKFTLDAQSKKIAFLSGGIGITPIRSITKYIVDSNTGTDVVIIYANRSLRDVVFREDFEAMEKNYDRLKVAHVLCEAAPGFTCTVGLINSTVIKNEVPDFKERKFYLCGPPSMVEAMKKILSFELSLPDGQIITENFAGY
ncbi:MAG: hypothetical protein KBA46_08445 [Candidatus Omnitrophica bacterium]|nr:hypothetical protein [Candidatus Omnitrophota bacterium]